MYIIDFSVYYEWNENEWKLLSSQYLVVCGLIKSFLRRKLAATTTN